MRVGGRSPRTVDVRFVAATNRDLEAASQRGAFREDLYFRLNGISLTVPPLRERRGDIGALAPQLLAAASRQMDRAHPPTLSPAALAVMEAEPEVDEGKTVIAVTHDVTLAGRAHRVIRLADGHVSADTDALRVCA